MQTEEYLKSCSHVRDDQLAERYRQFVELTSAIHIPNQTLDDQIDLRITT